MLLTARQAADWLGVPRAFMARLLDEGAVPHRLVGPHRRVDWQDVVAYRKRRDEERHAAIVRMARRELEAGTYGTDSAENRQRGC